MEVHETPIKPTTPPRHPKNTKETSGVSPYSENPNAVNSDAESPSPDNQPQSNTYISNNQTVNIHRVSTADTLTDTEYEKMVSEFGKAAVDYQLQRISDHGYKGCNNYETINAWCKERANRPVGNPPSFQKKNSFHNFEERQYPDDYCGTSMDITTSDVEATNGNKYKTANLILLVYKKLILKIRSV